MNAFTPGARRAAEAREAARILGQPTYHGQPCAQGHSGQRYTSNKSCVERRRAREQTGWRQSGYLDDQQHVTPEMHNAMLAMLYPAEFDAMGWRMLAVQDGE
jgi:hypothetical protein